MRTHRARLRGLSGAAGPALMQLFDCRWLALPGRACDFAAYRLHSGKPTVRESFYERSERGYFAATTSRRRDLLYVENIQTVTPRRNASNRADGVGNGVQLDQSRLPQQARTMRASSTYPESLQETSARAPSRFDRPAATTGQIIQLSANRASATPVGERCRGDLGAIRTRLLAFRKRARR